MLKLVGIFLVVLGLVDLDTQVLRLKNILFVFIRLMGLDSTMFGFIGVCFVVYKLVGLAYWCFRLISVFLGFIWAICVDLTMLESVGICFRFLRLIDFDPLILKCICLGFLGLEGLVVLKFGPVGISL